MTENNSWETYEKCKDCFGIGQERAITYPHGPKPCDVMIVGQAPAPSRKLPRRRPVLFIDESGSTGSKSAKRLTKCLREIGQDPRKFYFTNLIKCICLIREKDGIEGNPEKCYHFLQDEMRARNPNRVIILGQKAGDFIRNSNDEKLMDKLSYAPHPAARISNEEYQKRLRNALNLKQI